jgi:hypothetical protein
MAGNWSTPVRICAAVVGIGAGLGLAFAAGTLVNDRPARAPLSGTAAADPPGEASRSASVEAPEGGTVVIKGFVGRIEHSVVEGSTISATIARADGFRMPNLDVDGTTLTATATTPLLRNVSCSDNGSLVIDGRRFTPEQLPVLRITSPANTRLRVEDATVGASIGATQSLLLDQIGCLDSTVGPVAGNADIELSGSGKVELASVGAGLTADLAGSGQLSAGAVTGATNVDLAGSGDVTVAQVTGPLDIEISGSGSVEIAGGQGPLEVDIAGSGRLIHRGTAVDPVVDIAGSGSVSVAAISGRERVDRAGSGRFTVDPTLSRP